MVGADCPYDYEGPAEQNVNFEQSGVLRGYSVASLATVHGEWQRLACTFLFRYPQSHLLIPIISFNIHIGCSMAVMNHTVTEHKSGRVLTAISTTFLDVLITKLAKQSLPLNRLSAATPGDLYNRL